MIACFLGFITDCLHGRTDQATDDGIDIRETLRRNLLEVDFRPLPVEATTAALSVSSFIQVLRKPATP